MILELGLLFGAYWGSKVYENAGASGEPAKAEDSKEDLERQHQRHLNGALVSMGLFATAGVIPGAVPLGMASFLYSAIPYMKNVEKSLVRDKKVNVDVVFFVADALTLGVRNYFTAALGLSMIHAGRYMVRKVRNDSAKLVSHLYQDLPQTVWLVVDGVEVECPLGDVKAGDLIVASSGTVIPVDGVIHDGVALIDQHALTGESQPAEKGEHDTVFANTIVLGGRIVIRVERSGSDTTSAQIAHVVLNSVSFKSGIQLKGERWADTLAFPMVASAMVILPVWGPVTTAVFLNAHIGARILLFAPLATLRHISEASTMGVLVKDGRALEQLGEVDTILFDKTGTLTTDEPEVRRIHALNGLTQREVLAYAATAERKLTHPIAKAIQKKAREEGVNLFEVADSSYTMGHGVSVHVEGRVIRVGSARFMRQEGLVIPAEALATLEDAHGRGNTFILVGVDEEIAGALELQPEIRAEAKDMIAQLRAFGIAHLAIVSGDDQAPTRRLAETLGMDEYFHNILPEQKAEIVEELQAKGRVVCFIGDGINDSIALKKANVSMSIAGATVIAKDMAEIVFMDGTLKRLVETMELSKRLDVNLRRSLALCLVPTVTNLLGAFVFNTSILTALMVNNVFSTIGVTNLYYKKKPALLPAEPPAEDLPVVSVKEPGVPIPFPQEARSVA